MESSATTIAPLLLRNLLTSLFIFFDNSLLSLAKRYKLLEFFRHLLTSSFLFSLRFLPSLYPSREDYPLKPSKPDNYAPTGGGGEPGIARALSQLLSIVNDIPVSSRKYEVVRSLAEKLMDDNMREGFDVLRKVNRTVLSAAFERTLTQLEAAVDQVNCGSGVYGPGPVEYGLGRVFRAVRDVSWTGFGKPRDVVTRSGNSAEKLAAELLWMAQKLAACGCTEEAVSRWASASNLSWMALLAESRVQGSLVKVSAFLFKEAKGMGGEEDDEIKREQHKQMKMKMLMSWVPLLCRASNGIDAPILSSSERAELERVLEEIIEMLDQEVEQEKVLSLWLHHFTYCPSSDWPNLHACYFRWCTASRKLLLVQ